MNNAESLPPNVNVKFIFRHSIRHNIKHGDSYENACLTNEGIALAQSFGKSIEYRIGYVASSDIKRCVQTLENILVARNESKKINISHDILGSVHIKEYQLANQTISLLGKLRNVIFCMQQNDLPGLNNIEICAKILLDYIFTNGNELETIDLFCTHDFQLAILAAVLFQYATNEFSIQTELWPMMMEGMLLYGTRNKFTCVWRDCKKNFVNFLLE